MVARAPFVARIEGALDHDQSVVGLMALDIAAGRRFPIFFDGQRYMGAVEAYLAAGFVSLFGHTPEVVALAPLLAFGLFVAGQYAVWSRWDGPATGHLAAALAAVGSPMLGLWGVVPRGGYIELLAWAQPALWAYREAARPSRVPPPPWRQAAWGFWLGLGYFLNPLALTVYATIALDWTFARHGCELIPAGARGHASRRHQAVRSLLRLGTAAGFVSLLAVCCHVDPRSTTGFPYVALGGVSQAPWALAAGVGGVLALLAVAAWWTRGPARTVEAIRTWPWSAAGFVAAWSPFAAFGLLVKAGVYPPAPSLPVWIAAPWKSGPSLRVAASSLGALVGSDPDALETVFVGQGVLPPEPTWPVVHDALLGLSPAVVAVALGLIAACVWSRRREWADLLALRRGEPSSPGVLAAGFLAVGLGLFLLQGTSPNASSVRYLVPLWVALPGVLACGLKAVPRRIGIAAALALLIAWGADHALLWADMNRRAPARGVAEELRHRGVRAIVAPTPVALVVANLTHGAVGAVEYQPIWPRLGARYLGRFAERGPVVCVTDRRFPWSIRGEGGWAPGQDLGAHLSRLRDCHPGRVRLAWSRDGFDVWEVDLPLRDILAPVDDDGPVTNPHAVASTSR
jgi:hypothetical protein